MRESTYEGNLPQTRTKGSLTFSARSLSYSASSFRTRTSRWCRLASRALAVLWALTSSASCWASCACNCATAFCRFTMLDTSSIAVPELDPRFERGMSSGSVCTPMSRVLVIVDGAIFSGAALLSNTATFEVWNWSSKSEASLAVICAYRSRTDVLERRQVTN